MVQVGKRRKKTPGAKHKPSHHFCGHFRGPDSSDKSTGVQRADLWRIGDRAASMRWQKGYAMLCRYPDLRIATACDNTSVATKIAKWQLRSRRIGTEVQNSSILVATHCNINSFDRCGCETRTEWVESTNLSSVGSLSQVIKTNHMQVLQGLQGWRFLKYIEPRIYIWNQSMEIQWNTKIPWNVEVSVQKVCELQNRKLVSIGTKRVPKFKKVPNCRSCQYLHMQNLAGGVKLGQSDLSIRLQQKIVMISVDFQRTRHMLQRMSSTLLARATAKSWAGRGNGIKVSAIKPGQKIPKVSSYCTYVVTDVLFSSDMFFTSTCFHPGLSTRR